MDKKILFQAIKKLKKEELIALLETAYINLEERELRYVFGDFYKELTKKNLTPNQLLATIKQFYEKSLRGDYYSSFMINSKNFTDIPEETDEWFDEISDYLDFTSDIIKTKDYKIGIECFTILFELIEKMESGEEIVFADELGDWMIHAESDYVENYIIALANTATVEAYTKALIPLIKNDSYSSFYRKVYKKVSKHSSPDQLKAIKTKIKFQGIKTS